MSISILSVDTVKALQDCYQNYRNKNIESLPEHIKHRDHDLDLYFGGALAVFADLITNIDRSCFGNALFMSLQSQDREFVREYINSGPLKELDADTLRRLAGSPFAGVLNEESHDNLCQNIDVLEPDSVYDYGIQHASQKISSILFA